MILSIIIVLLVLPIYNNFVERTLSLNMFEDSKSILSILLIVIFVGLFGGAYPAFYISSIKPVSILNKTLGIKSKRWGLRNLLITVQFSITIILIICTLIVKDQLNYMLNKDVGYDRDQIIVVHNADRGIANNIDALKAELKKNNYITEVAASNYLPNNINSYMGGMLPDKSSDKFHRAWTGYVDYDFIKLYDIEILEGRNFSTEIKSDEGTAVLINEKASKIIKWESPVGKDFTYRGSRKGKIVGIMKDFHFHSLHLPIEPSMLILNPRAVSYISVKIKTENISEALNYLEKTLKDFSPNYPFRYSFFDEIFERDYRSEQRVGSIFGSFAFLAVILACVGLFGLSFFTAAQKTKEIGVRKVLGANIQDITLLLFKEFTKWVLIANVVAWPAAYFLMNNWIRDFTYRVDINWIIFFLAGITALLLAVLTVSYQSIKAARANPVDSLKYE